jgi:phosphate starvation-inducible membrane PsiE
MQIVPNVVFLSFSLTFLVRLLVRDEESPDAIHVASHAIKMLTSFMLIIPKTQPIQNTAAAATLCEIWGDAIVMDS